MKNTYKNIPSYLKEYIVEQNYSSYTSIDHACWRFIMRISKDFFSKHAHNSYLEGLDKTGITIDRIANIDEMNNKLSQIGWLAVPVRGFLPPSIFMKFQSLGILPIACDMRTVNHLTYTPAPDIVHEAAGHSPIIVDSSYSKYLKNYGQVSSKAISSLEDQDVYLAIRNLSDIKESPKASDLDIKKAENNLNNALDNISFISESAYLARMNWWTVEYGLIGDISNPKIYGAGLLSSVGESAHFLDTSVKKLPFSIDCLKYDYDITEPQPQLFVTPNFEKLSEVLDEYANTMSYRLGGFIGTKRAIQSKNVCTTVLDDGLEISGILQSVIGTDKDIDYLKFRGPVQISIDGNQIDGHGGDYHSEGYSTPLGELKGFQGSINKLSNLDIKKIGIELDNAIILQFKSGIRLEGIIKHIYRHKGMISIITFIDCKVSIGDKILFDPSWGNFDLICGHKILSVYGGPGDWPLYRPFMNTELPPKSIPNHIKKISSNKNELIDLYTEVRNIRENKKESSVTLIEIYNSLCSKNSDDWLLKMEILESSKMLNQQDLADCIINDLHSLCDKNSDIKDSIDRGISLIEALYTT